MSDGPILLASYLDARTGRTTTVRVPCVEVADDTYSCVAGTLDLTLLVERANRRVTIRRITP